MLEGILFAGASAGHATLIICSHNWWYGSPLGRRVIDAIQMLHGLLLLAGPVLFWRLAHGFDLRTLFSPSAGLPQLLGAGYVALCWLAGFGVLPAVTLARLLRRCPALIQEQTRVIDVARELGQRPVGEGKHRLAGYLPFNEVFQIELAEKTLEIPNLPAEWDGLTILHLSDFHFCGTPAQVYHEKVIELCLAWKPDLVALTGDYVDGLAFHDWLRPVLGKLSAPEGVLAILGNHDTWYEPEQVRERLRQLGFRVLGHQWEQIEIRGRPMVVVGQEGPWVRPDPELGDAPEGVFRLCLSHTPDNMRWARRQGIDLMLSGHVHGGQVRLPVLGSIVVPSQCGRRYDCGVFQEENTVLHVSRGLGGEHPLRLFCRPEAVLLRLRKPTRGAGWGS